ncbi:MAG: hypothetical protein JW741_06570 [Sedimentisphaerales bacterium]|nr:hypothetical protein [Sedimentisphaerales bacterium]
MANGAVGYEGEHELDIPVREYYFVGSQTLQAGQPLCLQEAAANTVKGRGVDVEIPNTDNERLFAGIVHPSAVGKTGPCWIKAYRPRSGDVLDVLCSNVAAIAVNDLLHLDEDVPSATASTGEGGLAKLVLDSGTVTTSAAQDDIVAAANAQALIAARQGMAIAMDSLAAASATAARARSTVTVQFL